MLQALIHAGHVAVPRDHHVAGHCHVDLSCLYRHRDLTPRFGAQQVVATYRSVRNRIVPLAVDGSTTTPPCVICNSPRATMRRAARRAGSIRSRHSSPPMARAASEGQIVQSCARAWSSVTMVASSCKSVALTPCDRHAAEQYFTKSQFLAHFARHSMRRPQEAHVLSARTAAASASAGCR